MGRKPDESRREDGNTSRSPRSNEYKARQREAARVRYAAKREEILARQQMQRQANRDVIRERQRQYREANREIIREREVMRLHGLSAADWATLWDSQGGRCYLCGEEMEREDARVDHDHSCCPKLHSCSFCRRGLCHNWCNRAIGFAGDDPDRLERMAAALRLAKDAAAQRIAACPVQVMLNV